MTPRQLRTHAIHHAVLAAAHERATELGRPLRVLDLGGGSGELAVPLAAAGHPVLVVEPSPDAIASLGRRARESRVDHLIAVRQGDAETLLTLLGADGPVRSLERPVDLVCCHGVLEVVDDPERTVADLAGLLAPGGLLSVVVGGRLAAVLAKALAGEFDRALAILTSVDGRWGPNDSSPRRFDLDQIRDLVERAGLSQVQAQGVRIFSDLLGTRAGDSDAERMALRELEDAASRSAEHPELAQLAAALHVLARRPGAE